MSTTEAVPRRPVIVTIAVVFAYISAFSSTAFGILVLLSRYQVDAADVLPTSLLGAGIILFGLLTLGVASGLARGSRLARTAATAYLVLELALHVWAIVSTEFDPTAIVLIAVDLFVIAALWLPPGARHFRR